MIRISGKRKDGSNLKEDSTSAIVNVVELASSANVSKPDAGLSEASSSFVSTTQRSNAKDDLNDKDQSLTCIMQVLFALSNKESRVPFRNSKVREYHNFNDICPYTVLTYYLSCMVLVGLVAHESTAALTRPRKYEPRRTRNDAKDPHDRPCLSTRESSS